ncbi:hypothetical protein AGMMS49982_22410 [Bacteroidia bacterium]|nr:hypothetical protein AGMMS49982_22410 [Bacteroidia bacterium]
MKRIFKLSAYRLSKVFENSTNNITEIKLNCYGYNYPNVKTRRSYLPDGTLFNENLTSEVDCPWGIDSEKYSVEELAQRGAFAGRV